jgi:predicted DNA binding CopG/RHH family protein
LELLRTAAENQHEFLLTTREAYVKTSFGSGQVGLGMQEWQRDVARITITVMAADAFIICRVTSETKTRVRALAARDGIGESTLIKQLLDVVLRTSSLEGPPPPAASERARDCERLNVRLAPEIGRLLRERARARAMPYATYASSVLRCHLLGAAPLPKAEYLALMQSVAELGAIGRNLNQIARAMNQGGKPSMPGIEEVGDMLKIAAALRDHIRALLEANARSWEVGHAKSSP